MQSRQGDPYLGGDADSEAVLVSVIQRDAHGFDKVAVMQLQQELARAVQRSHLLEQLGPPCFDPLYHQLLPPAVGHLCTQDNASLPEFHKRKLLCCC